MEITGHNQTRELINNQLHQEENRLQEVQENLSRSESEESTERLEEEVANFTALFVKQMFDSMRDTVPESDFIDGGFAEDVFTDMLDQEISEMGSEQSTFKRLNEVLLQQLT